MTHLLVVLGVCLFFLIIGIHADDDKEDSVNCPSLFPNFQPSPSLSCHTCRFLTDAWLQLNKRLERDDFQSLCKSKYIQQSKIVQKKRTATRYWMSEGVKVYDLNRELFREGDGETPTPMSPQDNMELVCYPYFLEKMCERFGEDYGEVLEDIASSSESMSSQKFCSLRSKVCLPSTIKSFTTKDRIQYLKYMGRATKDGGQKGFNPYVAEENDENKYVRNPYAAGGDLAHENELLE
eukprot:PhF_6_TR41644/c0_g1_i4/m.63126